MFDIITIGDTVLDNVLVLDEKDSDITLSSDKKFLCLHYADKINVMHTFQSVGGNAANVAVGIRKLGLSPTMVTELGQDATGTTIYDALTRTGIDMSLVSLSKKITTRFAVVLNYKSERTILSHHAPHRYKLPVLPKSSWIFYTSLSTGFETLQKSLIKHVKKNPDTQLAMNPGSHQLTHHRDTILHILPQTHILFVNKQEAQQLAHTSTTSIKKLCALLHALGAREIVITDSRNGAYASDGTLIRHMPIYPIEPIARTGAGDAFTSGYLCARIRHHDIPTALQWGTANAGGVIQEFGAQNGLLTQSHVKKIINTYPTIMPTIV